MSIKILSIVVNFFFIQFIVDKLINNLITGSLIPSSLNSYWPSIISCLVSLPLFFIKSNNKQITCKIGSLTWDRNAFCRGWLITGSTGSGKTQCGINILMHQVFLRENGSRNEFKNSSIAPWGGICIDEKGLYWQTLKQMAKHYDREKDLVLLQTKPDGANSSWVPEFKFNLLSDDRIPSNTYASSIVKTSVSVAGGEGDKGFFRTQAESNIGWAIELIRAINRIQKDIGISKEDRTTPNLKLILKILTDQSAFEELLQENDTISDALDVIPCYNPHQTNLDVDESGNEMIPEPEQDESSNTKLIECINHFKNRYWNQPKDQLGGVQGTIYNYLNYFTNDEIADVFCSENTFDFDSIDEGKIICIAMPQKLQVERRYVCTMLKLLFYTHVLRRFDKPKAEFDKKNLLICWQDEAQRFITEADGNVDVLRESGATTIMACQSKTSLYPPLGNKEKANVTILNLRNRMIFKASDEDCAQSSAEFIGKKNNVRRDYSYGKGGRNVSIRKEEIYRIMPSNLRQMKDFTAVISHSDGFLAKYLIQPKTPDNKIPEWWSSRAPLKAKLLRANFLKMKI